MSHIWFINKYNKYSRCKVINIDTEQEFIQVKYEGSNMTKWYTMKRFNEVFKA